MKQKIKYVKKTQATYCHKGHVLIQVWQDKK